MEPDWLRLQFAKATLLIQVQSFLNESKNKDSFQLGFYSASYFGALSKHFP